MFRKRRSFTAAQKAEADVEIVCVTTRRRASGVSAHEKTQRGWRRASLGFR